MATELATAVLRGAHLEARDLAKRYLDEEAENRKRRQQEAKGADAIRAMRRF